MSNPFNEDFRWGMLGGAFAVVVVVAFVSVVYKFGSLVAYQDIVDQCEGRYHEFKMFGKYYSCQVKP